MHWPEVITNGLWRGAIAVIPLALITAAICRQLKHRPGARHGLWLITMLGLIAIPFVPTAVKPPVQLVDDAPAPMQDRRPTPCDFDESVVDGSSDQRDTHAAFPNQVASAEPPFDGLIDQRDINLESGHGSTGATDPTATVDSEIYNGGDFAVGRVDSPVTFAESNSSATAAPVQTDVDVEMLAKFDESPGADSSQVAPTPSESLIQQYIPTVVGTWRRWVGQLAAARDALGGISPIPASLWVFGSLLYAMLYWINAVRWKRRIQRADNAPYDTRQLVHRVARSLGLKRVPQCVIVKRRISPMIWCGWPQRLVLPAELWDELDGDGRLAVVTHELAHMRRRDHWVRWVDVAVGCLYWWHPVVWWVRSRISAEAEDCCDAWVTWLNPKNRRAYAEALLTARQFISSDVHTAPALGIGAATRKSKNFARRLTMIMTRKDIPKMAATDWLLAIAVVCAGWLAIPAQSGAAEPPQADNAYVVVASDDGVITVGSTDSVAPVVTTVASAPAAHGVAAHDHHDAHEHGDHNDAMESRLDRLERQMSRLMELMESNQSRSGRGSVLSRRRAPALTTPTPPTPPAQPSRPSQSFFDSAPSSPMGLNFKRSYKMPKGQLEAMINLMSRDDVPVLISPGKDAITVQGTAAQHEVFKRFVDAIGSDETKRVKIGGGKKDALAELMSRNDVPIRVAPGDDHIDVIGSPAEQQAFADFVKLIQGESVADAPSARGRTIWRKGSAPLGNNQSQSLNFKFDNAQKMLQIAREKAAKSNTVAVQVERNALREQVRRLRSQAQLLNVQRDSIEQAADQLREQAEKLREQRERSLEELEDMREHADRADRAEIDTARELTAQLAASQQVIESLQSKIDQAAASADAHALESDFLEAQIDELESQADQLEAQGDELEAAASMHEDEIDGLDGVES